MRITQVPGRGIHNCFSTLLTQHLFCLKSEETALCSLWILSRESLSITSVAHHAQNNTQLPSKAYMALRDKVHVYLRLISHDWAPHLFCHCCFFLCFTHFKLIPASWPLCSVIPPLEFPLQRFPPLSMGHMFQDTQWMPDPVDSTGPYTYYMFSDSQDGYE